MKRKAKHVKPSKDVANKILHQVIGPANFNWSAYPEIMKGSTIFQENSQV